MNVIVDEKTAVCPRLTVHDAPEHAGDVMADGPGIPGHVVQKPWTLESAKIKMIAADLNILVVIEVFGYEILTKND